MTYLDYSKLPAFTAAHFRNFTDEKRVGRLRQFVSDYVDIIRFFGPQGLRPGDVSVRYFNQPFEIHDLTIAEFAGRAASQMRRENRLHDGPPVMKLVDVDLSSNTPGITVQPCDYTLQAGTCFALDLPDKTFQSVGGTLRDYYRRGCIVPSVDNNPLAICLGICGGLVVAERGSSYLLRVERSSHLASLENTGGPSVAGVVDYITGYPSLGALIDAAMGAEVEEELNLRPDEYEVVPLAWAIELFRGERPQIFCMVRTLLGRDEISSRLDSVPPDRREFDRYDFLPMYGGSTLDRKHLDPLNFEARMNFFLMEEYLSL